MVSSGERRLTALERARNGACANGCAKCAVLAIHADDGTLVPPDARDVLARCDGNPMSLTAMLLTINEDANANPATA
jgi:hypothetical protein